MFDYVQNLQNGEFLTKTQYLVFAECCCCVSNLSFQLPVIGQLEWASSANHRQKTTLFANTVATLGTHLTLWTSSMTWSQVKVFWTLRLRQLLQVLNSIFLTSSFIKYRSDVCLGGGDGGDVLAGQALQNGRLARVVQPEQQDPQLSVRRRLQFSFKKEK